jgi:hypothetical protein
MTCVVFGALDCIGSKFALELSGPGQAATLLALGATGLKMAWNGLSGKNIPSEVQDLPLWTIYKKPFEKSLYQAGVYKSFSKAVCFTSASALLLVSFASPGAHLLPYAQDGGNCSRPSPTVTTSPVMRNNAGF